MKRTAAGVVEQQWSENYIINAINSLYGLPVVAVAECKMTDKKAYKQGRKSAEVAGQRWWAVGCSCFHRTGCKMEDRQACKGKHKSAEAAEQQ